MTARTHASRPAVAAAAGLSLVGALAGCAATATGTGDTAATSGPVASTAASTSASSSASATASGSASASDYKDGSYTATGTYSSPGGEERIEVAITLADSKVTAVTVTPEAGDGNALVYQKFFASGISAQIVGKRIDELSGVSRVSGSSLTSKGFAEAVASIESQAKA